MANVRLGIGFERKPGILVWLAGKPPLLFRHAGSIPSNISRGVQSLPEYKIIQVASLRPPNHAPRLVETLQSKQAECEIPISDDTVWRESDLFAIVFRCFLVFAQLVVGHALTRIRGMMRVGLD